MINPDVVLEMYQNDDLRLLKAMQWRLLKDRDAKGGQNRDEFQTEWNLDTMKFKQIADADDFKYGSVTY